MIFGYFQPFLRLSNTTVSTCITWTQRTGLPIRGTLRNEHIYHSQNMTVQLAIIVHLDSIGEYVLPIKLNLLCSKYINDIFKVELFNHVPHVPIMFLAKTFRHQSILIVAIYFVCFDLLFVVVFKVPASSSGFNTSDVKWLLLLYPMWA